MHRSSLTVFMNALYCAGPLSWLRTSESSMKAGGKAGRNGHSCSTDNSALRKFLPCADYSKYTGTPTAGMRYSQWLRSCNVPAAGIRSGHIID